MCLQIELDPEKPKEPLPHNTASENTERLVERKLKPSLLSLFSLPGTGRARDRKSQGLQTKLGLWAQRSMPF